MIPSINPFAPDFKDKAYELYEILRTDDPVHYTTQVPFSNPTWIITRYDDAISLLKDKRLLKKTPVTFIEEQFSEDSLQSDWANLFNHMLNTDPPDHSRLRSLVQKAFTPRMVENLRPRIQDIANQLLDQVVKNNQMDLIQDYAFPLPIIVISEILGIPIEDRSQFRHWSNAIIYAFNRPDRRKQIIPEIVNFNHYLKELVAKRQQHLQDDLISALIQSSINSDKLSESEIYPMIFLLIIAGHETTVNLIGNGLFSLLQHPDQCEKLRNYPYYIDTAIEEFLRYMSPVEFATNRWAAEEIHLHGKTIAKNDLVLISLASANRDPTQFPHPNHLDITRQKNEHIAFGKGIHFCLGAPLARLEGQIAIQTLLQRIPQFELSVDRDQLEWQATFLMRGFKSIPIRF
ncbi:cytochrome P450 family protein [Thermoflavimicrobium daqui]|nr:cytochrome P450 [Thermoflavimicrobium daqui]